MPDNVIILGAGFSHDAGIPLMGGFVERMWEYAIKKTNGSEQLSPSDIEIFERAIKVRNELDGYHGRSTFNDRNIEDILSILSFNVLGGRRGDREKLTAINRAIARTIELSCTIKHPGVSSSGKNIATDEGPALYRDFWRSFISLFEKNKSFPTIITLNYDLILERSLFQLLINTHYYNYNRLPFESFSINYHYDKIPTQNFAIKYVSYRKEFKDIPGTVLEKAPSENPKNNLNIEILKLHGSLNFPKQAIAEETNYNLSESLDDPYILPPISNKILSDTATDIWKAALVRLREAKNIIIIGYSLPKTDIYMQYFLKAALGPNVDLNKIFVFDPVLYQSTTTDTDMRARYGECFSPQLQNRIIFSHPEEPSSFGTTIYAGTVYSYLGTTKHFVYLIKEKPEYLLF